MGSGTKRFDRTRRASRSRGLQIALAIGLCGMLMATRPAGAQTLFACEPEWAALTRTLLPEARIHVATHALQDPHHIEARPSLIAQLRAADAAICTGADLEAGWLPVLQQRSSNPKVQPGAPGLFFAADAVQLLKGGSGGTVLPGRVLPFDGDVHPHGNPHLHLDPRNILAVARAWAERLQTLFPQEQRAIARRAKAFEADWNARLPAWQARGERLRDLQIVSQHAGFGYLWAWIGLQPLADLEPRPGLAPTPGHLQKLLAQTRASPPHAIVVSSYQDPRSAQWLARQLGGRVRVLQLPATIEPDDADRGLTRWFDQILEMLESVR
jgi:zinc/manganese transport system substrate-binding protein